MSKAQNTSEQGLAPVPGRPSALEIGDQAGRLLGRGPPAQGREEELLDPPGRVEVRRLGDRRERRPFLEAGRPRHETAVHQRERLEDRGLRLGRPLLLAGELLEERGAGRIRHERDPPDRGFLGHQANRLGQAGVELLSAQPAHRHPREQARCRKIFAGVQHRNRFVGSGAGAAELVGPAQDDGPDQELPVETMVHEAACQRVEKLGVARWVVRPHVVDRVDQADAEEVGPDAVDRRAGEVGVLGRNHPLGQDRARRDLGPPGRLSAVEERRLHDLAGTGDRRLVAVGQLRGSCRPAPRPREGPARSRPEKNAA